MSGKASRSLRSRRRTRPSNGAGDATPTLSLALLALAALLAVGWLWLREGDVPRKPKPSEIADAAPSVIAEPAPTPELPAELTPRDDVPLPSPPEDRLANMVLVPAGEFLFGEENDPLELPAFYIDRYEVSQGEYFQFMEYIRRTGDHAHCHSDEPPQKDHTPLYWGRPDLTDPRYPVVGLDYWDVFAYASWVGKRLPTEQEWEKAARGADDRRFPWGTRWDPDRCNWGPSPGNEGRTLLPVDSMPEGVSPFGCYHMLGNAAEWTSSFIDEERRLHCGRGYCWRIGHMAPYLVTYRMPGRTNLRDEGSGLRCALDAPAGESRPEALP